MADDMESRVAKLEGVMTHVAASIEQIGQQLEERDNRMLQRIREMDDRYRVEISSVGSKVDTLGEAVVARGRVNWSMVVTIVLGGTMAVLALMSLSVTVAAMLGRMSISPVRQTVEAQGVEIDRLKQDLRNHEGLTGHTGLVQSLAVLDERFKRVDDAIDRVRESSDTRAASDERMLRELWERAFGPGGNRSPNP